MQQKRQAHLQESPKDDSHQNRHQSKQRILRRFQHRRARPNSGRRVHELEADVARVEAVVASDFFDGWISVCGEFDVDALFKH